MIQKTISKYKKSVDLGTLEYLAAVRVTIVVCESEDVQDMIGGFHNKNGHGGAVGYLDDQWRQLQDKVKGKLHQIGVHDYIIDIALANLWPISFEIAKWIIYHSEDTGFECSPNFCWTPNINIDYVKTAKTLVSNEALDIKKRFRLACIYCMHSEVRSLWEQMNLPERRSFFIRGNLKKFKKNQIVRYWTYYIQELPIGCWGTRVLNDTYLFKYAVENGYLRATRFFFGKIRENLKRMLSNCFSIYLRKLFNPECVVKDHLAIVCFLLGLYSSDYSLHHFNTYVFKYFLEWPMQKHFLRVVHRLRHRLKESNFGYVLKEILEKDLSGFKDYDYKKLFKDFWNQSPQQHKTYVREGSQVGYKIVITFVKTHFGFVFVENSFKMKAKFRAIVFQQEISENVTDLEKENVEFFKFLIQERILIRSTIVRITQHRDNDYLNELIFPFLGNVRELNLPMGELLYLIDGILASV